MIDSLSTQRRPRMCAECSAEWTIAPALSFPSFCPACGTSASAAALSTCKCAHPYRGHDVYSSERGLHAHGSCGACACERFKLDPPRLHAADFMREVGLSVARGLQGPAIRVWRHDDRTYTFARGHAEVRMQSRSLDAVVLTTFRHVCDEYDGSTYVQRFVKDGGKSFIMGKIGIGRTAVVIVRALGA